MARRWPQIRAVLVALHLVSIVVLSLPSGAALTNRRGWETPNAKAEFKNWSERLRAVGWDLTPEEFEAELWAVDSSFGRWRDRVAAPFAIYARYTGARQGWQMFATPQKVPGEVHLDVFVDGKWRSLVRPRDPRSNWRLAQRTHNRVRKQLGRFGRTFYRNQYDGFARWLASLAAADFPEARRIRVRLWRYHSLPPERVLAGEVPKGHYEHARHFDAEALR